MSGDERTELLFDTSAARSVCLQDSRSTLRCKSHKACGSKQVKFSGTGNESSADVKFDVKGVHTVEASPVLKKGTGVWLSSEGSCTTERMVGSRARSRVRHKMFFVSCCVFWFCSRAVCSFSSF